MPSFSIRSSYVVSSQAALTRVELLVLVSVLLILAIWGAQLLSGYLGRTDHAVENAHTISTLLSQYATDNNGAYPVGEGTLAVGKSEGIARNLLENNYAPDAAIFALGSAEKYGGKATDFSDLAAANVSWDFTAGATALTGITSADPDSLPTVYTTGENVIYPITPGKGLDLVLSGNGPFGMKGAVVAYKSNNAIFIRGVSAGDTTVCPGFIPTAFPGTGAYTQVKP